jgi:hypothetical protein
MNCGFFRHFKYCIFEQLPINHLSNNAVLFHGYLALPLGGHPKFLDWSHKPLIVNLQLGGSSTAISHECVNDIQGYFWF